MTIDVSSGGGVTLQVSVGLPGSADAAELIVPIAHLGDVNEDYLASIAAAMDAAAATIPGAIRCTVVGGPLIDDTGAVAPVELELLATVNAARDALLESVAPFAPELERDAAWRPAVQLDDPHTHVGTQWLLHELCMYAVIEGPLGRHTRVLHSSALGMRATIAT